MLVKLRNVTTSPVTDLTSMFTKPQSTDPSQHTFPQQMQQQPLFITPEQAPPKYMQQAPIEDSKDENLSSEETTTNIFFKRKHVFTRLRNSSHPPHYYHNAIAHIFYMLPKIRQIVLNTTSEDASMLLLSKTFRKLNLDNGENIIDPHGFYGLIGFPQKGYRKAPTTFTRVLNKLPTKIRQYISVLDTDEQLQLFQGSFVSDKPYLFIQLLKSGSTQSGLEPKLLVDVSILSKDKQNGDKQILKDIINNWLEHNQGIMNQIKDCYQIIEEYIGIVGDKQYYELVAIIMARGIDLKWGSQHEYWALAKDSKQEYNDENGNNWYEFSKSRGSTSLSELEIAKNLAKKNVKKGVPYFLVYAKMSVN